MEPGITFYVCPGASNLSPYACIESTLLFEANFQPHMSLLIPTKIIFKR